jgi:hypothetical protein
MRRAVALLAVGCLGVFAAVAAADNPPPTTTTTTTEPPPTLTLQLVKPKPGIVTKKRFTIVVQATGPEGEQITVKLRSNQGDIPPATRTGPSGSFSFPVHGDAQGGIYRFTVDATAGSLTAHLPISYKLEPPVTAIQAWEGRAVFAPGCSTCVINDPRGDTHRGPPDIKSVKSTYRHGWVTITIATYDTVSSAHGRHPCVQAWTIPRGVPRNQGFGFGCQEGPHLGKIWFPNGGCPHGDAYGDCGSAHESFPNSHTTRYRFRPSQLGKVYGFYWQVLVEVSDNDIRDTVPNQVSLSGSGRNCWLREQLVKQGPGAFSFGKNPCSQKGVVTKKP